MEAKIIPMPVPTELTLEQQIHWTTQLEAAERAVEVAKRMLGLLPIEEWLEG